jgi:Flp pilus assembly protein TadD
VNTIRLIPFGIARGYSKHIASSWLSAASWCVAVLSMTTITGACAASPVPSPAVARQIEQARQLLEKGDNAKAIEIAGQVLAHTESAELRNILGKAYARSGEPEKAALELSSAIRLQPGNEGFHFDLGQFLLRSGDFGNATAAMEDAKQRFPRSAQIALALGVAYYCSVRYDDAVRAFLRTIELAPDVPQPYVFLGKMLDHARSHLGEITRECLVAERLSSSNPYAPLLHAEVLIAELGPTDEQGKAAAAVKLLERVIVLRNDSAEAYFVFGCLMDRQGDYQRAARLLERCVQLKPDDPVARYRLGRLYVRLGKRDQADAEFAKQESLKQNAHRGAQ